MPKRLPLALLLGALAAPLPAAAQIYNYWNGGGSISVGTTTSQSSSTSREQGTGVTQTYGGSAYTVTGENITAGGALGPGQVYTVARPGEPFQYSQTQQDAGLTSVSTSSRTVDTTTLTNQLSVFANVGQ